MHIQKAKENAGFHKSAAVSRLRAEVARRKREISSLEEGGKNKYRQRNGREGGRDREEERMACYHGVQSKKSCLQPIHQLPATKFCLSNSLFSSPPLSPPSAFLPVFVISLEAARL